MRLARELLGQLDLPEMLSTAIVSAVLCFVNFVASFPYGCVLFPSLVPSLPPSREHH